MKNILNKILFGHAPRIKVAITAAIVWLITWGIAKAGFGNGADWSAQISTFAAVAAGYIMEAMAAKISGDGVKAIQTDLPQVIPVDGLPGPVTKAAVREVLDNTIPFNT